MTAVPLTDIEPLRSLLAVRPLGLFTDIDGTLAPIVERPEDAKVTARCRALLRDLIEAGVRVALISGRTLDVARSMVGLDGAAYAANHGLEVWVDGSTEPADGLAGYSELVQRVVGEARWLNSSGVSVEVKGPGVAFHYRRMADEKSAREAIFRAIEASTAAREFVISEGRKVIELRPRVEANKGTAARHLAHGLGVRSIISIGDDRTDIDMFRAVAALREDEMAGCSVAVLSPEMAPELLDAADYSVDGVTGVEWLLGELVAAIGPAVA